MTTPKKSEPEELVKTTTQDEHSTNKQEGWGTEHIHSAGSVQFSHTKLGLKYTSSHHTLLPSYLQ